jgi:hypothetical protein
MELRDFFAAHLAAALAHRVERPEAIAARAYELADALVAERAKRYGAWDGPLEEGDVDPYFAAQDSFFHAEGLLDEPAPLSERDEELSPALFDRDIDPGWEAEPKWEEPPRSERPGLARTTPVTAVPQKRQA